MVILSSAFAIFPTRLAWFPPRSARFTGYFFSLLYTCLLTFSLLIAYTAILQTFRFDFFLYSSYPRDPGGISHVLFPLSFLTGRSPFFPLNSATPPFYSLWLLPTFFLRMSLFCGVVRSPSPPWPPLLRFTDNHYPSGADDITAKRWNVSFPLLCDAGFRASNQHRP